MSDELKRDRRLRRRILEMLYRSLTVAMGGLNARALAGFLETDDDNHVLELLIHLRDAGYVTLEDTRTKKSIQRWGVDTLFARVTDKGGRLIREEIPVDSMVDDERAEEE